jgi:poly-gamma-glutamate capsule biosynthesis protein CapA/YwtB (metallophosphatase superfamily)
MLFCRTDYDKEHTFYVGNFLYSVTDEHTRICETVRKVLFRTFLQTRNLEISVQTSNIKCVQMQMPKVATKNCHLLYVVHHNKPIRVGQNMQVFYNRGDST